MRLLNVRSLEFQDHFHPLPPYVVASHRWKRGTEAMIGDIRGRLNTEKDGYIKVRGFAKYVAAHIPHVDWLWIDTCCINQDSDRELSEAINSMFKWYCEAEVCLAYMVDVKTSDNLDAFEASEWFRRGWTLQELLAPRTVVFLTQDWRVIGHKGGTGCGKSGFNITLGPCLTPSVVAASGVPESVLTDFSHSKECTIDERLEWMSRRDTLYPEDLSYSLLGIFDVTMSVRYGEGAERARERLLTKLRKKMSDDPQRLAMPEATRGTPVRPSSNIPFRRDPDIVDRCTLMRDIQKKLARPAGRAALVGLGGAGKSQLAIEFAHRARQDRREKSVFWIHASNAARFEQGVRDLADLVKIQGRENANADVFKLVRDWLRDGAGGSWILVLDNVDDASFLIERREARPSFFEYLPVCDHGSILITSRSENTALKLVDRADMIAVNPMDKETAIFLLQKKLGKQEDQKIASELVEALEYMPLAITQAAAYITQRRGRCSLEQYVEKMRKSGRSNQGILDFEAGDLRRDGEARNSIMLTWQISFEHIHDLRRSAADLLSLMSFCDGQAIPEALLRVRGSDDEGSDGTGSEDLTMEGDLSDDETLVDSNAAEPDECCADASLDGSDAGCDGFDEDISMLQSYSFVGVTNDSSVFEMHGLVQLATRKWLKSQSQLERWKGRFVHNLCDVFPPTGEFENWKRCQMFFPHAKAAAALDLRDREAALKWAQVMHNASWYAKATGDASTAEAMARQAFKARVKLLGDDDHETMLSQARVADALGARGRLDEEVEMELRLVEKSKQVRGEEDLDTLAEINNLALTYWNQGKWDKSEELQLQALQSYKKLLGEEHRNTLSIMNNLALTYHDQGRLSEAEQLHLQVVENRKRLLGTEHPDTQTSMHNLASTYVGQERLSEAEELQKQVVSGRQKLLGEEHPSTLTALGSLAFTYEKQGRRSEAEELENQVLCSRQKVQGEDHPSTLVAMNNLAHTLKNKGDDRRAHELLGDCILKSTRILGPSDRWTVRCTEILAEWTSE